MEIKVSYSKKKKSLQVKKINKVANTTEMENNKKEIRKLEDYFRWFNIQRGEITEKEEKRKENGPIKQNISQTEGLLSFS